MNVTSITVDKQLKRRLDALKAHPRESYNDVIARLASKDSDKDMDTESLIETMDILSDPKMMRGIAKSLEQLKRKDKLYDLDEV